MRGRQADKSEQMYLRMKGVYIVHWYGHVFNIALIDHDSENWTWYAYEYHVRADKDEHIISALIKYIFFSSDYNFNCIKHEINVISLIFKWKF